MKPAPFDYVRPGGVDEAVEVLAAHGGEAKILAGGQSLVPLMNLRLARPAVLVDVNALPGLDRIDDEAALVKDSGAWLVVGALVRHERLAADPVVRRHVPLLAEAASWIGHGAIRTRGTVGGSLAHADPAAELPAAVVALDAQLVAAGPGGRRRTIPAREFFSGLFTTTLADDELLTEIRIPLGLPGRRRRYGFAEFARRHGDFALVLAAVVVDREAGETGETGKTGETASVTVVLGGVASAPLAVAGLDPGAPVATLATHCAAACDPPGDVHASTAYRRALVEILVTRALERAR